MIKIIDVKVDPDNIELFDPMAAMLDQKDEVISGFVQSKYFTDKKMRRLEKENQKLKNAYIQRREADRKNKEHVLYMHKVIYYEQNDTSCPCMSTILCIYKHILPGRFKKNVEAYYQRKIIDTNQIDAKVEKIMQWKPDSIPLDIEKDIETFNLDVEKEIEIRIEDPNQEVQRNN